MREGTAGAERGLADPAISRGAASGQRGLAELSSEIVACVRCPRLVAWRTQAARVKRAAFASDEYWARPLPGFGDPSARVLVVGLAPAAHGGNRTGRIFTGDRSGDWLFAALWRTGFGNQPGSVSPGDGLELRDCYVTAAVRCPPPANRPLPAERENCLPYLVRELSLLTDARAIVCLGGFAWGAAMRAVARLGGTAPRPRPRFGHGASVVIDRWTLLGCYHPSQQNTFTRRLTQGMMEEVLERARVAAGAGGD